MTLDSWAIQRWRPISKDMCQTGKLPAAVNISKQNHKVYLVKLESQWAISRGKRKIEQSPTSKIIEFPTTPVSASGNCKSHLIIKKLFALNLLKWLLQPLKPKATRLNQTIFKDVVDIQESNCQNGSDSGLKPTWKGVLYIHFLKPVQILVAVEMWVKIEQIKQYTRKISESNVILIANAVFKI